MVARLDADAKKAPENLRAEILFPVDRMRNVNRGRLELRTFDPDKDFADAQPLPPPQAAGKNPFVDQDRRLQAALPARDRGRDHSVPHVRADDRTTARSAFPLIVALHGLGGTEDAFFDNYDQKRFRRSPNSTATSSPRRSAIAWTAATGGASAIRRRIRARVGRRISASRT